MSEFKLDPVQHIVLKKDVKPADSFYIALSEGRVLSYLNISYPSQLRHMIRGLEELAAILYRIRMMKKIPIQKNRIVFSTYQGTYACNCKYIAEQLLQKHPEMEIIFLVDPPVYEDRERYEFPPKIYLAKKETAEAFWALASAHIWVDNSLSVIWKPVPKKKKQLYVNTWHGSLGIKRLDGNRFWRLLARYADHITNYFLTNSTFEEEVFRTSFWPHVKHLKTGHPRNDLFFHQEQTTTAREKVYETYHIPADVKTVLYAPTFRDNKEDVSAISLSFDDLTEALKKRFGGSWIVLCRLHYHNAQNEEFRHQLSENPHVIDASSYLDMQELMAAADAGVTDYSSWIFDYLFTGRPAFIYAADIEKYIHDRGFYYSLEDTPFGISRSDEELAQNIAAFDEKEYQIAVQTFLKEKGCYENGCASEKAAHFFTCISNSHSV